jgi:hypothetical protein
MPYLQTVRQQPLRSTAPDVALKMLFERCREYPGAGERLHPEEKKVGEEKQLHGCCIRLSLPLEIRHGQNARPCQQASDAAKERTINAGADLNNLAKEAAKREIVRTQWTLSAGRTKARSNFDTAIRTRPPFVNNAFALHR